MSHIATNRFTYWGQLGIILALTGIGLLVGQGIDALLIFAKNPTILSSPKTAMDNLLIPANANLLRIMQLIAVVFMFILPAFIYAKICHSKPFTHLGIKNNIYLPQLGLAILLILASLPLVGACRELTMHLPLGSYIKSQIVKSKDDYMKQIMVLGSMKNFAEYLFSLFIMAILPGIAEELFFRGAIQNLFTRWFKNPIAAILFTAFIFSAFHFEFSDFLGRFLLGIVLGWVFYLTGNILLNMAMHASFNALSITALYITQMQNGKIDLKNVEDNFSFLATIIATIIFILIGYYFYKQNKKINTQPPGLEILLPGFINTTNPFNSAD